MKALGYPKSELVEVMQNPDIYGALEEDEEAMIRKAFGKLDEFEDGRWAEKLGKP